MYSEGFIELGDIFESLTFNLLSKKSSEILYRIMRASEETSTEDGKTTKHISVQIDPIDLQKIREEAKIFCTPHIETFNRIKEMRASIQNHVNIGEIAPNDPLKFLERYQNPEEIAKKNIACFIRTLMAYVENAQTIKKIFKRYETTDDFGKIDRKKSIKKISEFINGELDGNYGSIPPLDCVKFIVLCCEFGMQAETITEEKQYQASNIGLDFEKECFDILTANNYDARETPKTGDYGADLIANKYGLSFAIQCKNHLKPVGIKAVQEAHSAKEYYLTDFAVVVSKSAFTNAALQLANKLNVMCINIDKLANISDTCSDYL